MTDQMNIGDKADKKRKKEVRKWTADELVALVRKKYSDTSKYSIFQEVNIGTGFGNNTWIDILVTHLWPSDEWRRVAIEVKVTRSDLLQELDNPTKNEVFREYCHEFWFLAPQGVIESTNELPPNVGWLCPRGSGLTVMRRAVTKKDATIDDEFMASMCRSAANETRGKLVEAERVFRENDESSKTVAMHIAALEVFGKARNHSFYLHSHAETEADIVSFLTRASEVSEDRAAAIEERKRLKEILEHFESKVSESFIATCQAVNGTLSAVDEAAHDAKFRWLDDNKKAEILGNTRDAKHERREQAREKLDADNRKLIRKIASDEIKGESDED